MQEGNNSDQTMEKKRAALYQKLVRVMWALVIFGALSVAGLFLYISSSNLPTFDDLENPNNNFASEVLAGNGKEVLGRYFVENRVPINFEDLSPHLVNALIATEDERYRDHSGIDGEALLRVMVRTVIFQQKSAGGGSTITQQLAKLLFTKTRAKNIWERSTQKLKEWITAVKLERSYTKEEIMAMYFNEFNFINGAYGIRAASEIYFGKSQDELAIEEAATLVGMLKNPALFNPIRRADTTRHRRMVVLSKMRDNEMITQMEYDSLRQRKMDMSNFNRKTHADGLAPYFRMELRKELKRILNRPENAKSDGTEYDIYKDGLKIYTTLDPIVQKHLEAAAQEHMTNLQERFLKVWSKRKKDPWEYKTEETTEVEMDARENSLKKMVETSNRYQALRTKFLNETIAKIQAKVDYNLRDRDIERMLEEDSKKGAIARLVAKKIIETPRALKYRKIMKDEHWKSLKMQWRKLKKAAEKEFNEPVEMTVFAYNAKQEKDTTMSPMDSIKYHRMFLQIGSMAVDPITGHVKAWVGGINHKYFQYDHVTSERQVGSTFKPFIYATAIQQQGMSPCFEVLDVPYTIHKGEGSFNLLEDWTPANANEKYSGEAYTLLRGLEYSKNTVSVFLMKQLRDTEPVRTLVHQMGLDKYKKRSNGTYRIPPQPSICLGATDLTVMEMTGAYTSFANNGMYNKPIFITRIEDRNGRKIYEEIPEDKPALTPYANYVMVEMLKRVTKKVYPGFNGIKVELGGKTGTTNDFVDGWFMGITPNLVVGTWVGGEDRWIRFLSIRDGSGAKMARPVFAKLISKLEADPESGFDVDAKFYRPKGDIGIELDCGVYIQDRPTEEEEPEEDESFGGDDFGDESEEEF